MFCCGFGQTTSVSSKATPLQTNTHHFHFSEIEQNEEKQIKQQWTKKKQHQRNNHSFMSLVYGHEFDV